MSRRSRWLALAWAIGLAAGGAAAAYFLTGGRWAAVGAVIGAVSGAFAPSAYEGLVNRAGQNEAWHAVAEKSPPRSWARLLNPRRELVGFLGREDELTALAGWCEDDQAGRLRLVTGPGGIGKTRLSVELADGMRQAGWTAERVGDGAEADAISKLRGAKRGRALLVVDYAETRTGLTQLLAELTGDEGAGVRVLLLARSAGDWLDRLGVAEPAVWDLVQTAKSELIELSPVVDAGLSDAQVVTLAVQAFARDQGLPEKMVEISGSAGRRRVLDLHAAALVAVLGEADTRTVTVDISQVLGELLRHEQHYWYDSARGFGLADGKDGATPRMLRQAIAAACLLGAATEDQARALPGRIPGLRPSAKIAEWLRVLYPPDSGNEWIGSVQPDRLAELHIVRELADSPDLARACLSRLDARQALQAATLLARASSDHPHAEELLRQALPSVADLITGGPAPAETLTMIYNAIPYPTVVLAPVAAALCQRILRLLPADTEPAIRANWLTNLGIWFSALGRPAEALPAEQEAVAIYRELAAASPDRYRPDLASSLSSLGFGFSELGRPAEGLPVSEEAVAMFRELAAATPDRYRPDLARSLTNLGIAFSELGRPAEALPAEQEAVAIHRKAAAASPDRYRRDLARSLTNLGIWFSALGRPAEGLPVIEEAVAIHRELAAASPDRYRPDLASSLSNLGAAFWELDRPAEALPVIEEAVAIHRELAAASPDRYRRELARSLGNLGAAFSELGRPAEGLPVIEEAVAIHRELAAASPDRYRPDLATSLSNLGAAFWELDRPAEALPVIEGAVAIHRELAAASQVGAVVLAHRGLSVLHGVQDPDREGFADQFSDFIGGGPQETGCFVVGGELAAGDAAAEDQCDDSSRHILVNAGQCDGFDGEPGFFSHLAAHAVRDGLAQFEHPARWLPMPVVAPSYEEGASVVKDDTGHADRVSWARSAHLHTSS